MGFLNFADLRVLIVAILITVLVLVLGTKKKWSVCPLILLILYVALLVTHVTLKIEPFIPNMITDFIGVMISIAAYLIIDEIEIRREKIEQVFEDKYKNK